MNLAQAIIFGMIAALEFRIAHHVGTRIEKILWTIAGICFLLAAILKATLVAMEL